ncbi:MAG: O6-methylguanine-DNA--protein-cysteine methyltransferase [Colwellia sp.]|jgi:O6-methylguanine-DNA--protein-cysteine methyltransferase
MLLWIIITYPIAINVINVNKLIKPHYAQIWQTIQLIPQGKVACYGQIADLAGLPGRARLVGKALGCIPVPLEDAVSERS